MWLPGYTRALAATLVLVTSIRAAGSVRIEPASEPMGTTFSVLLYGTGKARLETAAAAAFLDAHRLDRMLSNYLPESKGSQVNQFAAQPPVKVSMPAPPTIDSEAWTKPYFVEGRRWAAAHRQRDFRVFFCEDTTRQTCYSIP